MDYHAGDESAGDYEDKSLVHQNAPCRESANLMMIPRATGCQATFPRPGRGAICPGDAMLLPVYLDVYPSTASVRRQEAKPLILLNGPVAQPDRAAVS